jgi:Asp-tRNA(Asn)/Glu-tRNA(Gln) amidotransferase C subunit
LIQAKARKEHPEDVLAADRTEIGTWLACTKVVEQFESIETLRIVEDHNLFQGSNKGRDDETSESGSFLRLATRFNSTGSELNTTMIEHKKRN